MPLNSVQCHVKGLLNGLDVKANAPLETWITPPVWEAMNGPKCYVWGGKLLRVRQSMPRGLGFQKATWSLDLWLNFMSTPKNGGEDSTFPVIIDLVMDALVTAAMPVQLTDPITGQVTQLVEIGERLDLDYPPERAVNNQRMLMWGAHITVDAVEVIQR